MGSIDIIKPLNSVMSNAVCKSQQHQEKNSREHRESNPELVGETLPLCYAAPKTLIFVFASNNLRTGETTKELSLHSPGGSS